MRTYIKGLERHNDRKIFKPIAQVIWSSVTFPPGLLSPRGEKFVHDSKSRILNIDGLHHPDIRIYRDV